MRRFIMILTGLAMSAGILACGSGSIVIKVNGVDVDEVKWKETTHELGARLRFEHNCDGPYDFVLIQKRYYHPMEVGVEACSRKWIFSREMKGTLPGPWRARLTSSPFPPYRYAESVDSPRQIDALDPADTPSDTSAQSQEQSSDAPATNSADTAASSPVDTSATTDNDTLASHDATPPAVGDTD